MSTLLPVGAWRRPETPWAEAEWDRLERVTSRVALAVPSDARGTVGREARAVLRAYSTSFFLVTRFLPAHKRDKVEAIYAAVRYPDEIVDTFPLTPEEKLERLSGWLANYEVALQADSVHDALSRGVPCFLALFAAVVRDAGIPPDDYRAFIDAMRLDARPRTFDTLDSLIDDYIYGSAIVVGSFLTYVYGPSRPHEFPRALRSARALGIALQLTNFLRDVGEDQRRGRVYLPQALLRAEGVGPLDVRDPAQHPGINRVIHQLAMVAEDLYRRAAADLDAFAADSRTAIKACIDVYGQLNHRIANSKDGLVHRERVPFAEKYRVLPTSKYWRVPLAYLAQ
ncbi:MAG: phytoene/squalene synthase family protein [Vicinamibacterales bacterium]